MRPAFIPGVELSGRLYHEAVRPLLSRHFPGLAHTAALIGRGSEILGFDTQRSTDHDWGPRIQLFLHPGEPCAEVSRMLTEHLPATFAGYPMLPNGIVVTELGAWFEGHLGFDPRTEITTLDWLATPTQTFAEVTGGEVFHDDLGLHRIRRDLSWYPDDVWRYLLACQWQRVCEEEPFVGRCGDVGDDLGSAVVTARLVRDLMRLCLLLERVYPPYSKWLGSAFARLRFAARLTPMLTAALAATDWHDRERCLTAAYEAVGTLHNEAGLTEPVDPATRPFFDRPYRVLAAGRFSLALIAAIDDPALRDLPLTGAIDQFVDNTVALESRTFSRALFGLR
ncbi:hypothetical protein Lesp02_10370 [Lentzea sp. NBRC 105346]|uniref:DUF4037 domain-containing protein n=1 Tax=Lentzea sp. NBRC 105346 TaxID=3032205 RepID=UPI0024A5A7DE|nr:DUF4037 domain-containing protein [Lentzea sp. NBRC 105346]GLZ28847.1 hypothetical protein Lesp02_10370 [Lentzea sp. NBRC 105346]